MKNSLLIFCFLSITFSGFANTVQYAVSAIPPALIKNANVVKRMEEERFTLKSPGEAVYYRKYAITILNENGDKYSSFSQYYDKFVEIKKIEGLLYDAMGIKIKELKNKDIQDYSGVSDISLIDDNRVRFHSFYYKVYPYTIEYTVELKYNGTMFYPYWQPIDGEFCAVQQSKFIFECPLNYEFRYKSFNYDGQPVDQTAAMQRKIWEVKELPAIVREPYSPSLQQLTTGVIFGPTEFEMQNYKGNMKSWQELGKFMYALKEGRDELPANIKQKVHEITGGIKDPKEKIRALYEYMQKNTRYVSIQLGIGGWQPYDAKYVATKGYGDCKALSNYMYSMLKEAGIPSYYALINAGRTKSNIESAFPTAHFNHVILCAVLNSTDSVWLECTSQTMPSGYLGNFTDDRYALLITEEGGKLVRTPKYGLKENLQQRIIKAKLEPDGMLTAEIKTNYTGMQQDDLHMMINNLSKDKVKEYLSEELEFPTYTINNFSYKEKKNILPSIEEELFVTVEHYATISGKRLFIAPNIMTRSSRKLKAGDDRKYDIDLLIEYMDTDLVEIEIPGGYKPESIPTDVAIDSKFGKYKASVHIENNKITYTRSIEQYSGKFPKSDYSEMVKFYDAIYKADRNKLVFVKSE
jgi:hypothetical protein